MASGGVVPLAYAHFSPNHWRRLTMARQLRDLDVGDWRRMLAGHTRLQQAQVILRQLAGYRLTSLHMSQDEDRLVAAIDIILSLELSEERAQEGRE